MLVIVGNILIFFLLMFSTWFGFEIDWFESIWRPAFYFGVPIGAGVGVTAGLVFWVRHPVFTELSKDESEDVNIDEPLENLFSAAEAKYPVLGQISLSVLFLVPILMLLRGFAWMYDEPAGFAGYVAIFDGASSYLIPIFVLLYAANFVFRHFRDRQKDKERDAHRNLR